jgi:hypothetical protein
LSSMASGGPLREPLGVFFILVIAAVHSLFLATG